MANDLVPAGDRLERVEVVLDSVSNRLTRTETKLTQLMLFVGMQTDGRQPIIQLNEEAKHEGQD